ncbi:MAG: ABC transporter ATP-binding protein/permease [Clostridiales bacterium]|jgi:ATP-binding cassette subfamily B protein|nr:ABC transporter ATP-binding protein/permease [Clostridiales bacterium]
MLKVLKRLNAGEWLQILVSLAFIVAQVWLDLKLPDYMSEITRLTQTPGSEMADIWRQGGYMLACALGSVVSAVIVGFFAARVAASFARGLRGLLFSKVDSFSMEEINRFSTSSLITRSTNDVTQIQMFLTMGLQMIIKAPIMAVWAVTKIAGKGAEWLAATGGAVALLVAAITFLMIFVMPKFRQMQTLTDNLNQVTRENLTGLRVVRAYNAEDYQAGKFEKANAELTEAHLFTSRGMSVMMPLMGVIMSGLPLAIYWIGARLIDSAGIMDRLAIFSNMVVFMSYAMQVIMSFMMLVMLFVLWPRAAVSAKRVNEVLDAEPSIADGRAASGSSGLSGEIEFRNVSFKYPSAEEYVLRGVTFSARRGETVAFIGSTGSGKSTLVNLIPRFYDASEGEVLIDGVNVRDYSLRALYDKIGYAPQKAALFRGTIAENVAYGEKVSPNAEPVSEDAVRKAVAIAQGADFVEAMDGGYGAGVSQGGANLSGGQRQRIAIARAVCRDPEIYIFDDSFSALDYKTDRTLRAALRKETSGVTSVIVAQRIGTIMDADKIIVLDEGRVAGIGTHRELLETCGIYKEIAMSQLSEEELAS